MTTAPALFAHAVRMILHDPATTLRVLMPGILLIVASSIGFAQFLPSELLSPTLTPDQMPPVTGSDVGGVLLALVAGVAGYVVLAVFWHRHVLLMGEARETALYPGMGVMGAYLWRVIVVVLIQIAAAVPIMALTILIALVLPTMLVGLAAGILFFWIALRISLILPAAAMGRTMKVVESWQATAPMGGQIWGLAILLGLFSTVVAAVFGLISPPTTTLGVWLQTISYLIEAVISVSILTTLYGHLVEGRPLG